MALLNVINNTTVQVDEFTTDSSDLVLRIPLTSGETVQFTAETQFFTPRQIATNRADVLGVPSENIVEYTVNNTPVVKLPIGVVDITSPQLYPVSIVSDVYRGTGTFFRFEPGTSPTETPTIIRGVFDPNDTFQERQFDNFFQELTDDLAVPDEDLETLRDQRDAAMQAALALDDLAAATSAGDPQAIAEANQAIDEGLATAIRDEEPDPSSILEPEEADELGALDLVELTDDFGNIDAEEDIIDPTPEILEDDLIQKLPLLPGNNKLRGIDTINQAITLLNSGIQQIEDSSQTGVDEDGKCKFITIAKKKKGFLGIGKKSERKVSRETTQKKLDLLKQDIDAQRASAKVIFPTKSGVNVATSPSGAATVARLLANDTLRPGTFAATAGILTRPVGAGLRVPVSKKQALKILEETEKQLQKILDKECN
jgi:hypothetical protein